MKLSFKKNKNQIVLVPFIIGLIILLALRDVGGVSINKYLFLAYSAFFMAISNKENLVYLICFMFPLLWGLPGTYILLVFVFIYFFKNRTLSKKVVLLTTFFVLLEVLAIMFYPDINSTAVIQYICTIIVFFSLITDVNNIDYQKAIGLFLIGSSALCVILLVSTLKTAPSNWLDLFAKGWFRFGDIQSEETNTLMLKLNANNLAYHCVLGVSLSIVLMKKKQKQRLMLIVCTIIHFLLGVLSTSRTFILIMLLLIILIIWYSTKSIKAGVIVAVGVIVSGIVIFFFLQKNPLILEGFKTRFNDSTISTGGGRTVVFTKIMDAFLDNPRLWVFGTGVTDYKSVIGQVGSFHNATQQLLVCYGLPGMMIFLYGMLKPIYNGKKKELIYWLPFIACILFVQTIQFVNPSTIMLMYIVVVFALRLGESSLKSI